MSSKKIFEVALLLSATDKASRIINEVTRNAESRIGRMSKMGDKAFGVGVGAGAAGLAILAPLGMAVKAAEESEVANKRLAQTFKTMGEADGKAAKQAADYASALQMKIGVEDEEIMAVQSKIATFRKVSDETARMSGVFDRATAAAFDLAAGGFGEASQNAIQLGKALQDPARGATALARTGALNKSDIPLIKQIQATKGLAAAQEYVLKAVERQVKGQAANVATAGQKMRVKWSEVSETLGKVLLPQVSRAFGWVGRLADKFQKWAGDNPKLLSTVLKIVGGIGLFSLGVSGLAFVFGGLFKAISAVMWLGNAYKTLMLTMRAGQMAYTFSLLSTGSGFTAVSAGLKAMNLGFLTSPIFWFAAAIVGVVFLIYKYWDPIKNFFGKLWDGTKAVFSKFWQYLKTFMSFMVNPIGFIIGHWDKISGMFGKIWDKVKTFFKGALLYFLTLPLKFFQIGNDIISGIWNGLKAKATQLFNFVKELGHKIAGAFKSVLGIASPSKVFMDFGTNITEGASKGIQKGAPAAVSAARNMGQAVAPKSGGSRAGGGGSISVNFAPVISGSGNAQDIAAEVKKLIPSMIKEMESVLQRRQRLAFN